MGVTIHYRGTMDDTSRIEEFENRVVDLVFALGGTATIWRTHADHDPTRMLRGLIVEMAPGQSWAWRIWQGSFRFGRRWGRTYFQRRRIT